MNKKLIIVFLLVALLGLGFWFFGSDKEGDTEFSATPSAGAEIDYASDVVGTRIGTTTTGAMFSGDHTVASSTYRVKVGGAGMATFTMLATNASSTPSGSVNVSVFGSNDWDCTTASTTGGSMNPIITSDINWYDIGDHIAELAGTQTLTGTSTLTWSPTAGQATDFVLKDMSYQCIRVDVSASSTELLMQVRLK